MINNKKGLSMIVSTLIVILLVLVAIGIIWTVVRNVINEGTETLDIAAKCLDVNLQVTAVTCVTNTGVCQVTTERSAGGGAIDGVRYVVSDGISSTNEDGSAIAELEVATQPITEDETGAITTAYAAAYFLNAAGDKELCSASPDFTNIAITA